MNFSAEEIARLDSQLLTHYYKEISIFILLEGLFLFMILLLAFLPDKYFKNTQSSHFSEPKKAKYRNGRKLSRQELEAEQAHKKIKRSTKSKIFRLFAIIFLLCTCIVLIFVNHYQSADLQLDMDQNAYIVYEGEFKCEYHHVRHRSYYTFTFTDADGNQISLTGDHADYYGMNTGYYNGRVIYAKNSQYLFELTLE